MRPVPDSDALIHLLWTGGWDSTYRLLHLLIVDRKPVQPYYLIDPTRRSTGKELDTRRRIRQAVLARYPHAAALLLPSIIHDVSELPPNPATVALLDGLRRRGWLGEQYVWLADFAALRGLTRLELSINAEDRPRHRLAPDAEPLASDPTIYRLVDQPQDPSLELFRRFRFPIFTITKREMARRAADAGFADLMEMTWFCHTPRGGRPCGTCAPCRDIVGEGMGHRLPWTARFRRWSQMGSPRPPNAVSLPAWPNTFPPPGS
jgi:hypothetical protein